MIPITCLSNSSINHIIYRLKISASILAKIIINQTLKSKDFQEKISSRGSKYHKSWTHKESKDKIVLDNYQRMWYLGGIGRQKSFVVSTSIIIKSIYGVWGAF